MPIQGQRIIPAIKRVGLNRQVELDRVPFLTGYNRQRILLHLVCAPHGRRIVYFPYTDL